MSKYPHTLPYFRSHKGLPSSRRFSPHIPRSSWTPADPRGPHPIGPSVVASGTLTPSPSAFSSYGAVSSFGECGLPCGLYGSLCTLQLVRSVAQPSSPTATPGTGGWLGLTRPGLSPCKKRHVSLGARTSTLTGRRVKQSERQARAEPEHTGKVVHKAATLGGPVERVVRHSHARCFRG